MLKIRDMWIPLCSFAVTPCSNFMANAISRSEGNGEGKFYLLLV